MKCIRYFIGIKMMNGKNFWVQQHNGI